MKKKILAVLLTLCLVLGLLPLSAMAKTYMVSLGNTEYELEGNDTTGYKIVGASEDDVDQLYYYTFHKGTGDDADKITYYTISEIVDNTNEQHYFDQTSARVKFKAGAKYEITLNPGAGTLSGSNKVETGMDGKLAEVPAGPTPPAQKAESVTNADGSKTITTTTYDFDTWYTTETGSTKVTTDTVFSKDDTIFARYTENESKEEIPADEAKNIHTVTLDPNGGTLAGENTVLTNKDGKLETLPTAPTRDHYKFLGWFTAKTGGTAVTTDTVFRNDTTTIYAQWAPYITFDPNGGTVGESTDTFEIETDASGKLTSWPDDPELVGSKFLGWFSEDGKTQYTSESKFTEAITVYAKWEEVVEIEVKAETDGEGVSGTVTIKNGDDELDLTDEDAVDEWLEQNSGKSIEIKVEVESTNTGAKFVAAKITKEYVSLFAKADATVYVDTPMGEFELTKEDMDAIADLGEDITLGNEEESTDNEALPPAPSTSKSKSKLVSHVEVFLKDADGNPIDKSKLKGLKIKFTVATSLTLENNQTAKVWYLNLDKGGKGELTEKQDGLLNGGKITFTLNHFSEYVFGTEESTGNTTPTGGGGGGGGSASSGYSVSVSRTTNGTVSVSPSRAEEGDTVTITVRPNEGYELDTLTVKDADGNTIRTTKTSDGKYTFTMPDGKVTIEATFKAIEEEDTAPAPATPSFSDVPSSFWAYTQIRWVAEQGIMGGYANGTFGADNNTTRQALWMVLGRLSGELDTNSTMAEAREWAIANNVSDGTNPGNAMSRQQMVTMLYRYAQMKGYATNGSTELSTYPDAAGVASYAQDALSWAVANGVVTGTTDGRLNPEGTASRAHFAVFMYRFCGLYADEA